MPRLSAPCFAPALPEAPPTSPRRDVGLAALVTLGAFYWLYRGAVQPKTEFEITRDFLSALDCHELGQCVTLGPPSTTLGFHQGAVWIELLTLVGLFKGAAVAALNTVTALLALGVGTLYLVTRRWIDPSFALPSALLSLGMLGWMRDAGEFVNPSTEFFPAVLTGAAFLIFTLTGRRMMLVWAGIMLAHACHTHTGALCLIPTLLVLGGVGGPFTLLASFGAFVGASWITSAETVTRNLHDATIDRRVMIGGAIAAVIVARLLRSRVVRLGAPGRSILLAVSMLGPFFAFLIYRELPGVVKGGHAWLYWPPVVGPVVIGASALLTAPLRWVGRRFVPAASFASLIPVAAGVVSLRYQPDSLRTDHWTYEASDLVAERLIPRGWTFPRLSKGLQVDARYDLLLGLMPYTPRASENAAPFDPKKQVRLWHGDPQRLTPPPAGAEVIPVPSTRTAVVMSEIESWLDPWNATLCLSLPGEPPQCDSATENPDLGVEPFSFSHRLLMGDSVPVRPDQRTCRVSFVIPAQAGAGAVRDFRSTMPGWQIARADGFDADRPLPAKLVRLTARDSKPGSITLEVAYGDGFVPCLSSVQYPGVIEILPDDPEWVRQ